MTGASGIPAVPVGVVVGRLPDGRQIRAHTLSSAGGPTLTVLDLGATVRALHAFEPGPDGRRRNVVLGHRHAVDHYLAEPQPYFGAVVGRYANRIARSRFLLDGATHEVTSNEGPTCLHGGPDGFHRQLWSVTDRTRSTITLQLTSPHLDQGFPGELVAVVHYAVTEAGVRIEITARTSEPTVVNLTNHAYFNLHGEDSGTICDHLLTVDADSFLPVDEDKIPLGYAAPVHGTALDFTAPTLVADALASGDPHVARFGGIDHSFPLRGEGMRRAARLVEPASGRVLEIFTDQPALQVYTGDALDGSVRGTSGRPYPRGAGIALETQRHPDAPNQPLSPAVLRPGETYRSSTEWRLLTDEPSSRPRAWPWAAP